MKTTYKFMAIFLILILGNVVHGQNALIDRSFWKQQPSVEEIKAKINAGHSPTEMNANNFDAIVYALLENNSLETIKFLLAQGNPVDKITHDGRTYLMWAAYAGNLEIVKYLVSEGAKTDVIDQHGYTLFMFPASSGQSNTEMYDYMIGELGVDIREEKDRSGRNALLASAARLNDFELFDYFLSKGLDINSVDAKGNGVFHYAAQTGNKEVIEKLVNDYKVKTAANEKTNENAILFATRRSSRTGQTNLSFYQYLEEEFDLDPTIISTDGTNALHNLATRTKDLSIIKYFVEKGTDPNQLDEEGNNALVYASTRGSEEIVNYLISKTLDINLTNNDGASALTQAVKYNTLDIVKLLVANGADPKVVDKKGNTLAYHLVDSYRGDIEDFTQKAEYLKSQGINIKSKQSGGTTLVHAAIKKNDVELLKFLLAYGIDVNAKDENGETALHLAALQSQDEKMLKFLVEAGANRNIATAFDESAYDLAKNNEMLSDTNIEFLKPE